MLFEISKINSKSCFQQHLFKNNPSIYTHPALQTVQELSLKTISQLNGKVKSAHPSLFSLFNPSETLTKWKQAISVIPHSSCRRQAFAFQSNRPSANPLNDFMHALAAPQENKIKEVNNLSFISSEFSTKIVKVIKENSEFKTIRLKRPKEWNFKPGQYLEIRSESSSKPAILAVASGMGEDYIEITAKPSSNPAHSNYCLNRLPGEALIVTGPLGSYFPTHLASSDTPVLLLGGGSGLTALRSVMQSLPDSANTHMIYSAKKRDNLLYQDEIAQWKADGHTISLTQEKNSNFPEGRISDYLKAYDIKPNTLIFICGPKELVLDTTKLLVERGIPREFIYGSLPSTAKEGGPVYRADHPKMMT